MTRHTSRLGGRIGQCGTQAARTTRWLAACGLVGATLGGCIPSRFTIDLAPSDGVLRETSVLAEAGDAGATSKVALIDVEGLISHGSKPGLLAGGGNSVDDLAARLKKAESDPEVRAVVLRVNSPGGTVAASDTMYQEIVGFRARSKKPVVVSMAEVAASGGYYISLGADRIVAQPSSVTGSIGVIAQTINFSKGMAMIGIEARAVTSGANKDLANPLEPMRDAQYAILQGMIDDFYAGFRGLVATARPGIDASRLDTLADGRVFTGRQALEEGLVDELGGLREAFARAKELAGVSRARLVKYHEDGRVPTSAYASALAPTATGGAQVNLLQVNGLGLGGVGEASTGGAGFYYLWTSPLAN